MDESCVLSLKTYLLATAVDSAVVFVVHSKVPPGVASERDGARIAFFVLEEPDLFDSKLAGGLERSSARTRRAEGAAKGGCIVYIVENCVI